MTFAPVAGRGPAPADFSVTLANRAEFVDEVRRAAVTGTGFAAGKIGTSEKHWMYYPVLMAEETDRRRRFAFEAATRFHCRGSGVFPLTSPAMATFAAFYATHVRRLDSLGVMRDLTALEDMVLWNYAPPARTILFQDQEPDRGVPADDSRCYLPAFAGKRLLLVAPFAHLLRQRATRETFEAVWSRTGKRWFEPASVDSLEFPYGFEPATQERYGSAIALCNEVVAEMDRREFDVALIAAGALGIPLAAAAKAGGRIGISLGGHLQVLFGVLGQRWRDDPEWQARYINDAWLDMPRAYRPAAYETVCDNGCYW